MYEKQLYAWYEQMVDLNNQGRLWRYVMKFYNWFLFARCPKNTWIYATEDAKNVDKHSTCMCKI